MLYKKIGVSLIALLLSMTTVSTARAVDYVTVGQAYMFDGTITGLRMAYDTFEQGMADTAYPKSRELLFLHSLTRTAMLFVRADGGEVDSFLELAAKFDVELLGDSVDFDFIELYYPTNNRDAYRIPEDAPNQEEIKYLLNNWLAVEIGQIIETLDLIYNSPGDKFAIYFDPTQTGMLSTLKVGYGEVLALKGSLSAVKSLISGMSAYSLDVVNVNLIIQKIYAGFFSAEADLLSVNDEFLKLLPTSSDPTIGKDALAQASAEMIVALNCWIEAIEYIKSESQCCPEETGVERFLDIEPADFETADSAAANLIRLRDSILNDTSGVYNVETSKTYNLSCPAFQSGEMTAVYNYFNEIAGGSVIIATDTETTSWEITDAYCILDNPLNVGLELMRSDPSYWEGAYMDVLFNADKSEIIAANFYGWTQMYTYENIYGSLAAVETDDVEFDPNPIYGSSARYPDPINPRDMLPEFDQWNAPLPGTVAKGAGYDATLGGVLPDTTQSDWQIMGELQPAGVVMIPELYPYQYGTYPDTQQGMYGGVIGFWFDEQIIFEDIDGDVQCDSTGNLDIDRLYLGYYLYNLFGEITFNDKAPWSGRRIYELMLSYSPPSENIEGALKLVIEVDELGNPMAQLYQWRTEFDSGYWNMTGGMVSAYTTQAGVQFRMDVSQMGAIPFLPGRYVSLASYDNTDWMREKADVNLTHLRLGPLGCISGNVYFESPTTQLFVMESKDKAAAKEFMGKPAPAVFVQAYTDPAAPDESVVSSTMIDGFGDFTLEGIGLGWKGYVRAFAPVFGFDNPFELGCFQLHDITPASQWRPAVTGLSLDIRQPQTIEINSSVENYLYDHDYRQYIFSFDAIGGAYYGLGLVSYGLYYNDIIIYGRNGADPMSAMDWLTLPCPKSGKYFIELPDAYFDPDRTSGRYEIMLFSDMEHYAADVAGPEGIGLMDGKVDAYDLNAITAYWLETYADADINKIGNIDFEDFAILAEQWLSGVLN